MQNTPAGVIVTERFDSPLGEMVVCASDKGVCLLEFIDGGRVEDEFDQLRQLLGQQIVHGRNRHSEQAIQEIDEYFAGRRKVFDVALQMPGTPFQQAVWQALLTVPYGQTTSYQAQSDKIGKPKAIRAVAAANGANRISIIVPCHRIIGKDGSLTGYGGGLPRKRWLISHESSQDELILQP
jgi:AraC family transcriptional regulator of adaptative response/methylated-DNA-[protein]-cysteine methyltransferase